MEPGEIYLADFPEAGPHPVIVVSREELNRGHYALVVVCTSARFAPAGRHAGRTAAWTCPSIDFQALFRATIDGSMLKLIVARLRRKPFVYWRRKIEVAKHDDLGVLYLVQKLEEFLRFRMQDLFRGEACHK